MSVTARHEWHHDLKENCIAYKESLEWMGNAKERWFYLSIFMTKSDSDNVVLCN